MSEGSKTNSYPTTWPLKCHECGDRIKVELPADTEEGATGTARCHRGHALLFGYDGVTVMLLDEAFMERP
jgi:hypothetical protein